MLVRAALGGRNERTTISHGLTPSGSWMKKRNKLVTIAVANLVPCGRRVQKPWSVWAPNPGCRAGALAQLPKNMQLCYCSLQKRQASVVLANAAQTAMAQAFGVNGS
jgi:hypothetical protein